MNCSFFSQWVRKAFLFLVYSGEDISVEAASRFLGITLTEQSLSAKYHRNLFQNRLDLKDHMKPLSKNTDGLWSPSTLSCLRGGVVHGAPAHDKPRMVLFFVATPNNASARYGSNSQFHTWSAISTVLMEEEGKASNDLKSLKEAHARVMVDWLPEFCDSKGFLKYSIPGSVEDNIRMINDTIASEGWSKQIGVQQKKNKKTAH